MFLLRSQMTNDPPRTPHSDPEVEALLHFAPVVRKCVRHDGWLADRQREFIIALAVLGHAEQAAIAVGGTMSGVYKLRSADGGEGFAAAWDSALALHLRRNPRPEPKGRPSRGELQSGTGRTAWPGPAAMPPEGWVDPKLHYLTPQEFAQGILKRYWLKVGQERKARLEGRIVEADYYVRQLTWLEIALDLGGNAVDLLEQLRRGGHDVNDIVATPMSALLELARRHMWREKDEPERPPSAPLGDHDEEVATGEHPHWEYSWERDGPEKEWKGLEDDKAALHAEAQRAWEEKARAEAEAWAKREAARDGGGVGEE